jgi:DNA-binding transcriptional MocR family regulator
MRTNQAAADHPRYLQVADSIAEMIEGGTFAPGTRVPSLRRLSRQMVVSLTTAMEAYRVLEDRGLIEARPQSGFYVRAPKPLPPAPAKTSGGAAAVKLKSSELVLRLLQQASDSAFISFGAAAPHPSFLPIERLNRTLAREIRSHPETSQLYDEVRGFAHLRRQIARRALDAGYGLKPEEIIVTNGAHHAVYLSLAAITQPGDAVAVETPTYVGLLQILEALGLKVCEIATDPGDGICLQRLEEVLGEVQLTACVLVPTFGNPLGHSMPDASRRRLVELMAAASIPIIEDDVYGDLYFCQPRPQALKAYDRDGLVLYCSSFSKTLAPGYRVGWVAPGRYLKQVERQKYLTSVASPTPTQMAIAAYLESGGFDRHLRRLRGTYRGLVSKVSSAVAEHFPEGTRMTHPCGGHVLWVELPPEVDSIVLYELALQRGISFAPGPLFTACCGYRNFLRLNCAVPWSDSVEGALCALGSLAAQLRDA